MNAFEKIVYDKRDRLALITINRPERMNAIDPQTSAELLAAFSDFRDDDTLWVAVLTGSGERAFSAGNDLVAMSAAQQGGGASTAAVYARVPFGGITRNFTCPKPIIAAITDTVSPAGWRSRCRATSAFRRSTRSSACRK